jgi:hypothetical protein
MLVLVEPGLPLILNTCSLKFVMANIRDEFIKVKNNQIKVEVLV